MIVEGAGGGSGEGVVDKIMRVGVVGQLVGELGLGNVVAGTETATGTGNRFGIGIRTPAHNGSTSESVPCARCCFAFGQRLKEI